ncbi:hypothetical protein SAMN05216202_0534 [Pseudomonas mucidolens]|uniref:Uncharacterized protein n=1 Tax=Pseudomonas mucidolens TaxID=46679 RepID=A0A1H2LVG8_9PSED|nr:hypothetical protein SAMN05216202_0534 [Pseudomonas mucidolens]SQH35221.1 Uncharacterised protein [Pseudomonas mucidolens]
MAIRFFFSGGVSHCRSELAREELKSAALNQASRVFVNDLREQARSYSEMHICAT